MRHGKGLKKLNRTSSHRKALLMNLAIALFQHEQVKTTLPKAKLLRPFAEKLVTLAKNQDLNTTRKLLSVLNDDAEIVKKLLTDLGPRFNSRAGGYTRIYKCGFRYGDQAPMAIIEFVDRKAMIKKPSVDSSKKNIEIAKKSTKQAGENLPQKPKKIEARFKDKSPSPAPAKQHGKIKDSIKKAITPVRRVSNRKSTSV